MANYKTILTEIKADEAKLPAWSKSYTERGISTFDEREVAILRKIQGKYASDYAAFLEKLAEQFRTPAGKAKPGQREIVADIARTRSLVDDVVKHINELLGSQQRAATGDEIGGLFSALHVINARLRQYVQLYEHDKQFSARVEAAKAATGVDLKQMSTTVDLQRARCVGSPRQRRLHSDARS